MACNRGGGNSCRTNKTGANNGACCFYYNCGVCQKDPIRCGQFRPRPRPNIRQLSVYRADYLPPRCRGNRCVYDDDRDPICWRPPWNFDTRTCCGPTDCCNTLAATEAKLRALDDLLMQCDGSCYPDPDYACMHPNLSRNSVDYDDCGCETLDDGRWPFSCRPRRRIRRYREIDIDQTFRKEETPPPARAAPPPPPPPPEKKKSKDEN